MTVNSKRAECIAVGATPCVARHRATISDPVRATGCAAAALVVGSKNGHLDQIPVHAVRTQRGKGRSFCRLGTTHWIDEMTSRLRHEGRDG